jgi:hypothetical protein
VNKVICLVRTKCKILYQTVRKIKKVVCTLKTKMSVGALKIKGVVASSPDSKVPCSVM